MCLEELLKTIKANACKDEVPIVLYDLFEEGKVEREWNPKLKTFVWRVREENKP